MHSAKSFSVYSHLSLMKNLGLRVPSLCHYAERGVGGEGTERLSYLSKAAQLVMAEADWL